MQHSPTALRQFRFLEVTGGKLSNVIVRQRGEETGKEEWEEKSWYEGRENSASDAGGCRELYRHMGEQRGRN